MSRVAQHERFHTNFDDPAVGASSPYFFKKLRKRLISIDTLLCCFRSFIRASRFYENVFFRDINIFFPTLLISSVCFALGFFSKMLRRGKTCEKPRQDSHKNNKLLVNNFPSFLFCFALRHFFFLGKFSGKTS